MKRTVIRSIARAMIGRTQTIACPERQLWTQAMAAELDRIGSDWEALDFALGCLAAIGWETLRMRKFEPLIRWLLAFGVLAWAVAKVYLIVILSLKDGSAVSLALPDWIWATLSGAALLYAGAALALFAGRYLAFGLCLTCALAVISIQFGLAQWQFIRADFQPAEDLMWFFALISEDYFVWTAFLVGTAVMLFLKTCCRGRIALWPA